MLKGGQEAPTKPKGRPKKNSIPTSEEIEAEERLHRLAEEDSMKAEDADGNQVEEAEEDQGDKTVQINEQEETQNPESSSPSLPCTSLEASSNEQESLR